MKENILDGLDAMIALMRTIQIDRTVSEDLAEDALCMENFACRMLDKMLSVKLEAYRAQGSSETGHQQLN